MGLNYGFIRFKGDVTQHDHYPAYQEIGDFSELRTAASLSLIKRINPLYSISIELVCDEEISPYLKIMSLPTEIDSA